MNETNEKIEFRGHWTVSLLTVGFFLLFCILFFIILQSFEMHALAMGGFVSLLLSSLFVKKGFSETYWEAVYDGVKEAVPVMMLLLIIGMFAEMIKISNLSIGFFWIAANLNVSPALFTALTFLFVALISSATGSSIGTMFTCFPIFYAAGVLLGSHPAALAGAIVSGGIFGDNLAPISDTTIISSSTQEYAHRKGVADIGGSVRARFKYSIIAGICSFILFYLLGGRSEAHVLMNDLSMEGMSPNSLLMLIPVFMMLFVSMKKQNTRKLILSAMLLAIGFVLPMVTGQIRVIGNMLLPMHIPVLLCAFLCGPYYAAMIGALLPLMRSLVFSMPVFYPNAVAMAIELLSYGFICGLVYSLFKKKNIMSIYISLISAMLLGRAVWGVVTAILMGLSGNPIGFAYFIDRAFVTGIPGIVLQLILIPIIVAIVEKFRKKS